MLPPQLVPKFGLCPSGRCVSSFAKASCSDSESQRPEPKAPLHGCEKAVEVFGFLRVDTLRRAHVVLKGFEDSGIRLCVTLDWTEYAPLRRNAIRSLTNRLNVPVMSRKGSGSSPSVLTKLVVVPSRGHGGLLRKE